MPGTKKTAKKAAKKNQEQARKRVAAAKSDSKKKQKTAKLTDEERAIVDRRVLLKDFLEEHHATAAWLADQFQVPASVIKTDIKALLDSGVPVESGTGRNGGYWIDGDRQPTREPKRPTATGGTVVKKIPMKKATPAATKTTASGQIDISRIGTKTMLVPIVGMTPLLTHRFGPKAKRAMLDAMQGRKVPKQPKNPDAEYEAAAYRLDDEGYGIPAIAFKSATVSAARLFGKSVTMVSVRQSVFVGGEFAKIDGMMLARINGEPYMREDVVRVGNGGTDLRYRPCWNEWTTTLAVTYVESMFTGESVLSLIEAGGLTVGVGEWRPERKGEFGTFKIDQSREIEVSVSS